MKEFLLAMLVSICSTIESIAYALFSLDQNENLKKVLCCAAIVIQVIGQGVELDDKKSDKFIKAAEELVE